LSSSSG
jgi:chromosome segregation ATPase